MKLLRQLFGIGLAKPDSIFVPRAKLIQEHGEFLARCRGATRRDRAALLKCAAITRRAIAYGG